VAKTKRDDSMEKLPDLILKHLSKVVSHLVQEHNVHFHTIGSEKEVIIKFSFKPYEDDTGVSNARRT